MPDSQITNLYIDIQRSEEDAVINERSKGLFIQLYSKYYSEMHYWAKKVLDSDDIAEDLV